MRLSYLKTLALLAMIGGLAMSCAGPQANWRSPYKAIGSLEKGNIVHLPTGVTVTKEEMIEMIADARIVYVGESHDNVDAHQVQLDILKALAQHNPGRITVAVEMLKQSSQDIADQWSSGELEEKAFVRRWVADWSNDFAYYRDILTYIRDHRIPLLALRAPDAWMAEVKGEDVPDGDAPEVPLPELDVEDPYHRSQIEAIFEKHPGANDFEQFYKVQVLWDESMAARIHEYLTSKGGKGQQLVVFAGSQHIEHGFGIPRRVFRRIPASYRIILPVPLEAPKGPKHQLMRGVSQPEVPLPAADFLWAVGYEDLEDERVYLGVMVQPAENGIKIIGISSESAAAEAGLEKGDIIQAFDGQPVDTTFDLTYLIGRKEPADTATLEVLRGESLLSVEVTFKEGGFHP